jgi:hypothetical protein
MSVALTAQAVVERRKTVTRRLGWTFLKPGDRLTLCRKVQGRRRRDGTVEPLVRLAEVEVLSVRRERLINITAPEVRKEGFGHWIDELGRHGARVKFLDFFCNAMHVGRATFVTRIEWRYLDGEVSQSVSATQRDPAA